MDIVRFKGGLGNQMFQYALVEALRSRGRRVGCSLGFYRNHPELMPFSLDKVFENLNLDLVDDDAFEEINQRWREIADNPEKRGLFEEDIQNRFFWVEKSGQVYEPDVFETRNATYVGYWQSEKYFKDIRKHILDKFCFTISEIALKELGDELEKEYVGIHIRRGDYLKLPQFNICTKKYYTDAIGVMQEKFPNVKFIFFSDDKEWVEKNFDLDGMRICSEGYFRTYEDWYDMYLMSRCKGNIIANSTFSWWGAWLNQNSNQIVVAPKEWKKDVYTPDIWCENWIRM